MDPKHPAVLFAVVPPPPRPTIPSNVSAIPTSSDLARLDADHT
jgi:hypothetical protein